MVCIWNVLIWGWTFQGNSFQNMFKEEKNDYVVLCPKIITTV